MNECYVDSVCWIAILNKDDELHQIADKEYKRWLKSNIKLVTSTFVLVEVANSLCKPKHRNSVVEFYRRLKSSKRIEIISIDRKLWSSGWILYENRPDKAWSLTDCISIEIM